MASDWSVLLRPTPRRILDAMLAGATSLTAISESTGLGKSTLLPHLKELAALGVVKHERVPTATGTEAHYRLQDVSLHLAIDATRGAAVAWASTGSWDAGLPLLGQVAQADVRREVTSFLRGLGDADVVIVLFGSAARGEATWKSDLDLIAIVPRRDAAVASVIERAADAAQTDSQHALQVSVVDREEWSSSRKRILQEARREGLVVHARRGEDAPWGTLERYRSISL